METIQVFLPILNTSMADMLKGLNGHFDIVARKQQVSGSDKDAIIKSVEQLKKEGQPIPRNHEIVIKEKAEIVDRTTGDSLDILDYDIQERVVTCEPLVYGSVSSKLTVQHLAEDLCTCMSVDIAHKMVTSLLSSKMGSRGNFSDLARTLRHILSLMDEDSDARITTKGISDKVYGKLTEKAIPMALNSVNETIKEIVYVGAKSDIRCQKESEKVEQRERTKARGYSVPTHQ